MIKVLFFVVVSVAACYGAATVKPVYCGEAPTNILRCLNNPHPLTLSHAVSSRCRDSQSNDCSSLTCTFRVNEWFNGTEIDKVKVSAHFNQLAKDKPEWKPVVDNIVQRCVQRVLPALGVHINCPAYDIMHCALVNFIKKSPDSQWSTAADCAYSRQYASACPVCPNDCFAPQVPLNSCNACYVVPDGVGIVP